MLEPPICIFKKKHNDSKRIKVMLRIDFDPFNLFSVDVWKKEIKINNKSYKFESIFESNTTSQYDICSSVLASGHILQSVVNDGIDACIFSYGQNKIIKNKTMFNTENSVGIMPTSLYWLFKIIDDVKLKSGNKFHIKLSVLEITGCKEERVRDLFLNNNNNNNNIRNYEKESALKKFEFLNLDFNNGQCLLVQSLSQVNVNNFKQAEKYLQKAFDSRTSNEYSHMLLTVHIHQHGSEDTNKINKKSKLHLFDIGKLNSTKLTQLNHTIMSTLNGQKHCIVSNTDSKLIHLMRETMCSSTQCRITMIAHINNKNDPDHLNENLKIIQLSAKLQKNSERFMKQQRVYKSLNSGFDESSIETMQLNRKLKANKKVIDCPSSSEMSSADTVIFIGKNGKKNYLKKSINNNNNQLLQVTKPTDRLNKPKLGVFSSYYNSKNRSSSSSSSSNEPITTLTKPNEIWIDGPKNSTSNHQELRQLATKILTPSLNDIKLNEIWIDGPKCSKVKAGCVESSFESLECLDRQLLKQLNDHDMDMHDSVNLNRINSSADSSRPISLLSVKSNDTTNNSISTVSSLMTLREDPSLVVVEETSGHSYKQKLEDLKQSYDQMIFKQSYKEMESLHKTLETFLNLDQTSKLKMMMKPIKSTVLTPACDLNKQFTTNMDSISSQKSQTKMTTNEKEKRLSRILSPTRFRPTPQIPNHSSSSSTTTTTTNSSSSDSSSSSSSSCSSVVLSSPNTNNYSIPLKHLTSSPIIASKRNPVSFEKFSPLFTKININNNNNNNEQQYSEPFDNLNRTIEKNLNQILKNSSNNDLNNSLLLVKNINTSRPLHNRMSKNETNRLFYNFNNQNHVIGSHLNGYRSSVNEQLQQQSYLAQPVFIPTSSVPSTPNQNRKKSNQDNITVTSSFKEIKHQKESILTRIFHRSKSTNKNTNQNLNLSNYSKERVVSTNSNNTSGFSESLLDKNSSNFNSMIGGIDLLTSSSGYESLSKENTNNSSNSTNDDSSDCLTTSSESGDVKYSTFNRVKSAIKNQKLISNLKQYSYSNINKSSISINNTVRTTTTNNNNNKPKKLNSFCGSSLNLFSSISCLQPNGPKGTVINNIKRNKLNKALDTKNEIKREADSVLETKIKVVKTFHA